MATLILQAAGSALGAAVGGPLGGLLGSSLGALAGSAVDAAVIGAIAGPQRYEGQRLTRLPNLGASEGAPLPRVYGRVRIGGQLIWATRFEEEVVTQRQGGGKGAGRSARVTTYAYYANFAVGLCEGEIESVRRIWADGQPLDLRGLTIRVHRGDEAQTADPLIVAKEGADHAPAYRGTAYVVFERLPLAAYGNRIPQLAFEVLRNPLGLGRDVRAINLIPGAGEFAYADALVTESPEPGRSLAANRHQLTHATDVEASLDALAAACPKLDAVTLIVAWFGDDLRAGHCAIAPRVETAAKVTQGETWRVAGIDRGMAQVVSSHAGGPAYGGTPSDRSVLQTIAAIKARGFKVHLHPFLMMDIPAGNALLDPWTGAATQPAYPWRGRISVDPAPGQLGSPDKTAAATVQIASLFGNAQPSDFAVADGEVVYSGPSEWSLRRFLLHYARLAELAGGVDAFFLCSELRGLAQARSAANAYPFATLLGALAADVRTVLGSATTLTYAADWTEYGAHVPETGEVGFPLDALWANPEIDCVAIDWYPPLTDWRDGTSHLDAALARGPADPAYLAVRIAGGEAYDWFYANVSDRAAQLRTPIGDGAYGKHWLYRPKDLVGWWSNSHVNRLAGVEVGATGWVPTGKPIWLAELGCPAVDRGANGPHVFPDAKSADGGLPAFSRGFRDDLQPLRLIAATLAHFDPSLGGAPSANPISPVYGGRMLDPARIHLWAWDARPFPAFPELADIWADAANYETGHWLTGRLEALPLDRLLAAMLADFGLAPALTLDLDAVVEGYVVDRPMSFRAALAPLADLFGFDTVLAADGFRALPRNRPPGLLLSAEDLVQSGDRPLAEHRRAEAGEVPASLTLAFSDDENAFRAASVTARRQDAVGERLAIGETAVVGRRAEMARRADIRLRDDAAAADTVEFGLGPAHLALQPGDVVALADGGGERSFLISRITDEAHRRVEARSLDRSVFEAPPPFHPRGHVAAPAIAGRPEPVILDLPVSRGEPSELQHLAAFADPWPGSLVVWRSADGASFAPVATLPFAATMGELIDPLPPGPVSRWDHAASFRVKLFGHTLQAVSDLAALGGANTLAIKAPAGTVEVLAAAGAVLEAPATYRLSRLIRGIGGSEAAAASGAPAGSRVVVLNEALTALASDPAEVGRLWHYRIAPDGVDHADARAVALDLAPTAAALLPFAPVRASARRIAGGVMLGWIRRSRIGGDAWDLYEIPLGEATEAYEVVILDGLGAVKRTLSAIIPGLLYPAADETADFGGPQASLRLRIAQVGATVGPGRVLDVTIPVH